MKTGADDFDTHDHGSIDRGLNHAMKPVYKVQSVNRKPRTDARTKRAAALIAQRIPLQHRRT